MEYILITYNVASVHQYIKNKELPISTILINCCILGCLLSWVTGCHIWLRDGCFWHGRAWSWLCRLRCLRCLVRCRKATNSCGHHTLTPITLNTALVLCPSGIGIRWGQGCCWNSGLWGQTRCKGFSIVSQNRLLKQFTLDQLKGLLANLNATKGISLKVLEVHWLGLGQSLLFSFFPCPPSCKPWHGLQIQVNLWLQDQAELEEQPQLQMQTWQQLCEGRVVGPFPEFVHHFADIHLMIKGMDLTELLVITMVIGDPLS